MSEFSFVRVSEYKHITWIERNENITDEFSINNF